MLKTDGSDKEYLEYSTERQTKTRSGDNPHNIRPVKPRMYENNAVPKERNPVAAYKLYAFEQPQGTLQDSPFYLSINHISSQKFAFPGLKLFKSQPMGVNKLNSIIKTCAAKAGLTDDKCFTNTHLRPKPEVTESEAEGPQNSKWRTKLQKEIHLTNV